MTEPLSDHQAAGDTSVWWRNRWLAAMYDSDLTPTQRFVATVYADFAGSGRTSWSSLTTVMHRTGYSERTVVYARNQLMAAGWLVAVSKSTRHLAATYALVIPTSSRPATDAPLDDLDLQQMQGRPATDAGVDLQEMQGSNPLEKIHQSSLSPNQAALRKVLGCAPEDERVMIADSLFATHNVRSAPAWLRSVKAAGELDDLIAHEMRPRATSPNSRLDSNGDETWMQNRTRSPIDGAIVQAPTEQSFWTRKYKEPCTLGCENGFIPAGDNTVTRCPQCHPAMRDTA